MNLIHIRSHSGGYLRICTFFSPRMSTPAVDEHSNVHLNGNLTSPRLDNLMVMLPEERSSQIKKCQSESSMQKKTYLLSNSDDDIQVVLTTAAESSVAEVMETSI